MPKVMIAVNSAWNLVNFRAGLIQSLVAAGHEVVAVAPRDDYEPQLQALGCRYLHLPMDTQGTHPLRDAMLLWRFMQILRRERPHVFLGYTVKPNVYGSLAARVLRVPIINNIAGLGAVFITQGWVTRVVRQLYRLALSGSAKVFFQNDDDRQLFITQRLVSADKTDLLPGSGINLARFLPSPLPRGPRVRFLLVARMLWDKGVGEYVEAARILRTRGVPAEFCLLGFLDVQNPAAISKAQMSDWVAEGTIQYLGTSNDVRNEVAHADCVVLPSYREGTPRSLLEAAAMARPIVTTDSVGCREVVDNGVNGYLCRVKDAADLAEKMEKICKMPPSEREAMGLRGRQKVSLEFDESIVIQKYLDAIDSVLMQGKKA
jgi:glycosyltransferase involved in cell wall biosynthesis